MNASFYQNFKLTILSLVHLSKDAVHIYIGLLVLFLWVLVSRKALRSFKVLVPVFLVAVVMELLDMRDNYHSFRAYRWSASFHDILNTSFWPVIIVLLFKFRLIKS